MVNTTCLDYSISKEFSTGRVRPVDGLFPEIITDFCLQLSHSRALKIDKFYMPPFLLVALGGVIRNVDGIDWKKGQVA
jgi:hypothetical protein